MAQAITHDDLCELQQCFTADFAPYGDVDRESDAYRGDCSCGCRFALPVAGECGEDWVVCCNPGSHRVGLLTFEHQGCMAFEALDGDDA